MKKIAFLASSNYQSIIEKCPDFIDELALLTKHFAAFSAELVPVDWHDERVNWKTFDRVIPKACWDYSEHPEKFLAYLKRMEGEKIEFRNPVQTLIWNMRKTYLADLKSKGYSVAELKIIPEKSEFNFGKIIEEFGSETSVVVKPSVSGGARNTIRCKAGELKKEETLLQTILSESDLIIQPYFPEIADEGEYSFFYFGGKYSHAIVKKPAKGDFRAHQLFGAKNLKYEPNREEIAEVAKFTLARGEPMPYARVDVFRRNQKFLLVELELIEPYLYFEHAPVSALDDFCKAILA